MEPWNLGIFTIMAVMVTVIGILLASRFVYLDNRYSNIIRTNEMKIQELNDERDKPDSDNEKIITEQLRVSFSVGEYISKRADNRGIGIWVDIFSLLGIIILGIITTFGVFDDSIRFTLLVTFSMLLFLVPLVNFLRHVRYVNKFKSD